MAWSVPLLVWTAWALGTAAPDDPLRSCFDRIELGVDGGHSCLMRETSESGRTQEAIAWLRARGKRHPDAAADVVTLGRLLARARQPDASRTLTRGIDAAVREGDRYAEVMGRVSDARLQADRVGVAEAELQLDAARAAAHTQADPFLALEVSIAHASILRLQSARLGHAEATLRRALSEYGEPQHAAQAIRFHSVWAAIAVTTGRLEAAVHRYRHAAELAEETGELRMVARLRYNEAVALRRLARERGQGYEGRSTQALETVIETGLALADDELVAMARAMLGSTAEPATAVPMLRQCLEQTSPSSTYRVGCLRALAWYRAQHDISEGEQLLEEALSLSQQPSAMPELAESLSLWTDVLWTRGDRVASLAEGLAVVEVVETLRTMQDDAVARARVSAAWASSYYELAGRALDVTQGAPEGAALALDLMERLRARALRDALADHGAPAPEEPAAPLQMDEAFFDRLARRRVELRALANTGVSSLAPEAAATIDAIRAKLSPREAMLSFQLDDRPAFETALGRDGGGSWVTVITAEGVAVHALEDASALDAKMQTYLGLFMGDASALPSTGRALADALLADALASLSSQVDTLIVIPDGHMHRLPIAALHIAARVGDADAPLAQRYRVSSVPSAALWLDWKAQGPVPVDRPAHLFADPPIPPESATSGFRTAQLPPLPRAREEVRRIANLLGDGARVYEGDDASEARLLDASLHGGVFHFATHAVLDPDNPQRAALVLAADGVHDGVADVRTIASHPRPASVVVLAACRGADGLMLRGEGVMGLARGFLQSGARAVVASLWPLSDAQAERLFPLFYAQLARGETVASALALSQRELIDGGDPPEAWAGLVVVGDGAARPYAEAATPPAPPRWLGIPLLLLGAASVTVGWRRRSLAKQ